MPTYSLTAITTGSFPLGESDKILTLFSAERGPVRAVAKGARRPGAKISGRSDVLCVNKLLVATGKSLDIITQVEGIETFQKLRVNLERLSYGLYYAELTNTFGQGVSDESGVYYEFLLNGLRKLSEAANDPGLMCLEFELQVLELLGYKPELDVCVLCRSAVTEYLLAAFHYDLGGVVCEKCFTSNNRTVRERSGSEFDDGSSMGATTHITPMVWKRLVLASHASESTNDSANKNLVKANQAARRIIQGYIEHRAGRRMKALDLIS